MTDIRRTLLWVVFATSLFLLWDGWNKANGRPSLFSPAPRAAAGASAPGAAPGVVPPPLAAAVPPAAGAAPAPIVAAPASGVAAGSVANVAQNVVVRTDVVVATFSNIGGTLVRLELPRYSDAADRTQPVVLFDQSANREYLAQTGLVTREPGVALPNHLTPMTVVPGPRELAPGAGEVVLRFESQPVDGRTLTKTYTLRRGDYAIAVRHEVKNAGATPIDPQLYLQLARDGRAPADASSFYSTFTGPAIYHDSAKFRKLDFKDIEKGDHSHDGSANDGWIAMVQHYFASAWLVAAPGQREFRTMKLPGQDLYTVSMVLPLGSVAPGSTKAQDAVLFAGPQEEEKLASLAPGLDLVKDYGWLTPLSKPLFWLLGKLHGVLGNWGWAIVALVVLLKIGFYWLNASAYRSMAKMKAINPRVMEMRERFKDKPQQMQQEMMRIYREEKVNPLGGCLPILVQMPFFIALYWVLLSSVEMRNAPWIGWITDLSAKDPWFILPVLMTATSLVQVALGAKPPDPMQARMMWLMPLAFSVMFFFFPAGLVLYWLTNNLLSIAQQWMINRQLGVSNR